MSAWFPVVMIYGSAPVFKVGLSLVGTGRHGVSVTVHQRIGGYSRPTPMTKDTVTTAT